MFSEAKLTCSWNKLSLETCQFNQVQNPFYIPFCCSEVLGSACTLLQSSNLVAWVSATGDKLVAAAVRQ